MRFVAGVLVGFALERVVAWLSTGWCVLLRLLRSPDEGSPLLVERAVSRAFPEVFGDQRPRSEFKGNLETNRNAPTPQRWEHAVGSLPGAIVYRLLHGESSMVAYGLAIVSLGVSYLATGYWPLGAAHVQTGACVVVWAVASSATKPAAEKAVLFGVASVSALSLLQGASPPDAANVVGEVVDVVLAVAIVVVLAGMILQKRYPVAGRRVLGVGLLVVAAADAYWAFAFSGAIDHYALTMGAAALGSLWCAFALGLGSGTPVRTRSRA